MKPCQGAKLKKNTLGNFLADKNLAKAGDSAGSSGSAGSFIDNFALDSGFGFCYHRYT